MNKILMPKELTAENGAKALLSGEFFEFIETTEEDIRLPIPVSWSTIKDIYKKTVEHYGEKPDLISRAAVLKMLDDMCDNEWLVNNAAYIINRVKEKIKQM
jgi:hypothetical protein